MHVAFVSHKTCWPDPGSPSGYATVGGFPYHVRGVAGAFDATTLVVPVREGAAPQGAQPLVGHNLRVLPLPEPRGERLPRKLALLAWLPRNLPRLWKAVRSADAVHAPVPGDIGTLGVLVALLQRKPLFVRHCGTWGEPVTRADRMLLHLLERIAGGRNVVMATGGGEEPPSARNPDVSWIFSTTLTEAAAAELPVAEPWQPGVPLRLAAVGRLTRRKNFAAAVRAMPQIRAERPGATLDVLGGGAQYEELQALVEELGLEDAVHVHGNVAHDEVLAVLGRSHLFVFPTREKEGFPKAVIEAMACGLPVIAPPVSVLAHLIGEERGVVLEATTPEAVAEAVLQLTEDPDRLAERARAAAETGRTYTLEQWQEQIAQRLRPVWGPLKKLEAHPAEVPSVA